MAGILITFEGIEGCGKTTIAKFLYEFLDENGHVCRYAREPGGTAAGEALRALLLDGTVTLCNESELLLIEAARAQLMRELILPALQANEIVILDRYTDSTMAYQGYGREMDRELIARLNRFATQERKPDLTFLLDVDAVIGLARAREITARENLHDRFESEDIQFIERIRQGFLEIARKETDRMVLVDTHANLEIVWNHVKREFLRRF
ncbi:MAG: dTMP kinase [Candidatus Omnitrophota bacterium]|jgi:dTMP kinase|nr:MAG: dTMP kinase [Candidatus Omnitrophota bacterium]